MGYSALAGNTRRLLGLRKPVHLLGILRELQKSIGDGTSTAPGSVHVLRPRPSMVRPIDDETARNGH